MSNIIDKIQLSGVTYDIGGQGGSGVSVVEVTQAGYDALPTSAKTDTSKMYVITDAEAGDLTNYYTKTETNTLLDGKQATLVSGTNIKTINNESILGSGNIDIQGGGGVTIDPSLDSGSTNPVANSAITTAINSKVTDIVRHSADWAGSGVTTLNVTYDGTNETTRTFCASINNKQILTGSDYSRVNKFSLVETSAITTSITSSSTDAQVPSAKAVYDIVGNIETLLSQI